MTTLASLQAPARLMDEAARLDGRRCAYVTGWHRCRATTELAGFFLDPDGPRDASNVIVLCRFHAANALGQGGGRDGSDADRPSTPGSTSPGVNRVQRFRPDARDAETSDPDAILLSSAHRTPPAAHETGPGSHRTRSAGEAPGAGRRAPSGIEPSRQSNFDPEEYQA